MRYDLVTVRLSMGTAFFEGSFADRSAAVEGLASLHSDLDCLHGEVHEWRRTSLGWGNRAVIAQYGRADGEWREVIGKLRCRTEAADAEKIVRDWRGEHAP